MVGTGEGASTGVGAPPVAKAVVATETPKTPTKPPTRTPATESPAGVKHLTPAEVDAEQAAATAQVEADAQAVDAEQANRNMIVAATRSWAESGDSPQIARAVLEGIAKTAQVAVAGGEATAATQKVSRATTKKEIEDAEVAEARANKVLREADKRLKAHEKRFEALKDDPKAEVVDRLFAYDIDLARTRLELHEVEAAEQRLMVEKLSATASADEGDAASQARIEAADKQIKEAAEIKIELMKKVQELTDKRGKIGTAQERQVDYAAGIVLRLMGNRGEITSEQRDQIMANPLGYLQAQVDNPEIGLAKLLEASGIDQQEQKKIQNIASAEAAKKAVTINEVKGRVADTGKQGLFALLLIMYTAYGTNKKSKGQQAF